MRVLRFLLQKEFLQVFRNKGMLPIIFAIPIVQLVILVNAANFEIKEVRFAVFDKDKTQTSNALVNKLVATSYFSLKANTQSDDEGKSLMDNGEVDMILNFPVGFEKALAKENNSSLMVLVNAIDGSAASLIYYYTNAVIFDFNKNLVADWYRLPSAVNNPITIETRNWYNPELEYKNFMVPGLLVVLVTLVGMFLTAMNIVREKEIGTIEQLNVTPITKSQFILSKLIPLWVIGMFELCFGLVVGKLIFDFIIIGSIPLLLLFAALYLVAVLGIGLFVSTITRTQQQAMLISWFFIVIFILMSGLFTAIDNMPYWAQVITWFNPMAYFVEVMRMVLLKNSGFQHIIPHFIAIGLMAVVVNTLAVWNYRKRG